MTRTRRRARVDDDRQRTTDRAIEVVAIRVRPFVGVGVDVDVVGGSYRLRIERTPIANTRRERPSTRGDGRSRNASVER